MRLELNFNRTLP